ncbi:centrosomal protein of 104 kDa-like isoform X2 [Amphiura filiformis]|uniref:centrosomal protein of 104 kDa-like isoform X2 n=1 Tax=Amphiura filiformis TaxID=82378 RepID=UPI003B2282B3
MPHKVPFTAIHASSTDEGYNMKELEIHNPLVKGWQSSRFCLYPQEIILAFDEKIRIKKLQILAHQFLIATKIEFYVGSLPPDHITTLHGTRYKRLGYVAMADNEKTGFKARELKSVHVDAVGRYLRLVIHKNHVNKYNLYNQAGIVAINVIGDEMTENSETGTVDPRDVNNVINQYMPPGSTFRDNEGKVVDPAVVGAVNKPDFISPMDDLAFDMYQDPEVAQIIRKLDTRKNEAVIQEQYDIAKRLKQAIVDLQKVGERLGRYEVEKRRAIETEDYDLAKVKKIQMDEYRLQIYKQLELHDLLEMSKHDKKAIEDLSISKDQRTPRRDPPPHQNSSPPFLHNPSLHRDPGATSPTQVAKKQSPEPPPTVRNANYADDRPLPTHRHAGHDDSETGAVQPSPRKPTSPVAEPSPRDDDNDDFGEDKVPAGKKPGEKAEPISEKVQREAAGAIDIFGTELVSKIYSKNWSLREEGMKALASHLDNVGEGPEKEELRNMLRAAVVLAVKGVKDKVFAVYSATIALLRLILHQWIPRHKLPKGDTSQTVEKVLPELLARIGDGNTRLKAATVDFIVEMASFPEVYQIQTVPHQCVVPFKPSIQAKMAITRTDIVEKLVQSLKLEKSSGLTVENTTTFANHGLEHTQATVRDAAVNLIFELYKLKGQQVRSKLPSEEHPKVQKNRPLYGKLFDGLDKIDGKPTKAEKKAKVKADKVAEKKAKQAEIDDLTQQLADLRAAAATAQGKTPVPKENGDAVKPGNRSVSPVKAAQQRRMPRAPSIAEASEMGEDLDGQCVFCGEKDESFKEEGLDVHYWKFCPMLKRCGSCKQVVEISAINDHLLTECENKDKFAKCPRCQEAREKKEMDVHLSEKTCPRAKQGQARCPLCQKTFPQSEENWKKHLMGEDGCEANSRRLSALKKAKAKAAGTKEKPRKNSVVNETAKGKTANKGTKAKQQGKTPRVK